MIYTITFNPSLDYIMHVDDFELGETNRSRKEEIYAGGKGFNVSTILHYLGLKTTAVGFISGFSGKEIKRLINKKGFLTHFIELETGTSRINVKMKGKQETEINGAGPVITDEKIQELYTIIDQLNPTDMLVLAGSIPRTLSNDLYETIMKRLEDKHIQVVVDATGQLLTKVLPYHPFLIKPNKRELEELFKVEIHDVKTLLQYAKELQEMGALNVLVSMGKEGAILIDEHHKAYRCYGVNGTLVNSVGSGDSMVAGFIAGYLVNFDYKNALRLGSAAGSATAFQEDLAEKELIMKLYKEIRIKPIS